MNQIFSALFAVGVMLSLGTASAMQPLADDWTVNAVIGDESFIQTFGHAPTAETNEFVRVQTHLRYAETLLRARPVEHLSQERQAARAQHLDNLRTYWQAGAFPHNDGHEDTRRPTFISPDGNICAVGYLVEVSLGRDVAEAVNASFKYAFIGEIDTPAFYAWAESSGFTMEELAMIQPMYGEPQIIETNRNYVEAPYALSASVLTLSNAFMMISGSSDPRFGLAAGGGTILLGALNVDNRTLRDGICIGWSCSMMVESNHLRTGVSYTLIGVGAANVLMSGYRLIAGRAAEPDSPVQMGITHISSPTTSGEAVPSLQLSVRF